MVLPFPCLLILWPQQAHLYNGFSDFILLGHSKSESSEHVHLGRILHWLNNKGLYCVWVQNSSLLCHSAIPGLLTLQVRLYSHLSSGLC